MCTSYTTIQLVQRGRGWWTLVGSVHVPFRRGTLSFSILFTQSLSKSGHLSPFFSLLLVFLLAKTSFLADKTEIWSCSPFLSYSLSVRIERWVQKEGLLYKSDKLKCTIPFCLFIKTFFLGIIKEHGSWIWYGDSKVRYPPCIALRHLGELQLPLLCLLNSITAPLFLAF